MTMINMNIKNVSIGELDPNLVKNCMVKNGFASQEETLIYYFKKAWDFNVDDDLDECLRKAQKEVKTYGFEDIATLMAESMHRDLRPASETCQHCTWYAKKFCAYKLCRVNPFEKGCEGWHKNGEEIETPKIASFVSKNTVNDADNRSKNTSSKITNFDKDLCRTKEDAERIIEEVLKEYE